jgi:hypothetical protein
MISRKRFNPSVDGLESRLALSHASGSAVIASILAAQSHPIRLSGTIHGTATRQVLNPDVGALFHITASGRLAGLGNVTASGEANGTGFISQGRSTGSLTITNSKGSFTLMLEGPIQPGFTGLPSSYQFTISGGTGAYVGATGMGTAHLKVGPASSTGVSSITINFHRA